MKALAALAIACSVVLTAPAYAADVKADVNAGRTPRHHHRHPHQTFIIVQDRVLVAPVAASCFVPGYWTYQWVPQTLTYNVWVSGQYTWDWIWIEGHYEPRAYTTGTYQPLWIPDRRVC